MNTYIYNYTFIIPHKNSPTLLQRCLDSIPKRKDIQIIVVDDHSSSDMLNSPVFSNYKHPNIKFVYTQEGKGAGYARNMGVRHAQGKWLLFADADDYYVQDFINILDEKQNSHADIIYFNVYASNNQTLQNYKRLDDLISNYSPHKPETVRYLKYGFWAPWNKMFSYRFVKEHHLEFDEIPVGNDAFFSLRAGECSTSIEVLKDKLYCYVFNPNGITERKRDFKRELSFLDINFKINRFLRKHQLSHMQNILFRPFIIRSIYNRFGFQKTVSYLLHFIKRDSLLMNIYYFLYFKHHNMLV